MKDSTGFSFAYPMCISNFASECLEIVLYQEYDAFDCEHLNMTST